MTNRGHGKASLIAYRGVDQQVRAGLGVCDKFMGSFLGSCAVCPELFPTVALLTAPQSYDCVGSSDCPSHSRLFKTLTNDCLAGSFHYSRANKQSLCPELCILHSIGIAPEIINRAFDYLFSITCSWPEPVQRSHNTSDTSDIQLCCSGCPPVAGSLAASTIDSFGNVSQMLTGVVQINDLNRSRKMHIGQRPYPLRSITEHD